MSHGEISSLAPYIRRFAPRPVEVSLGAKPRPPSADATGGVVKKRKRAVAKPAAKLAGARPIPPPAALVDYGGSDDDDEG